LLDQLHLSAMPPNWGGWKVLLPLELKLNIVGCALRGVNWKLPRLMLREVLFRILFGEIDP
jgi:hypothetical protein